MTGGGEIETGTVIFDLDSTNKLLVVIKDNGKGIKETDLPNVFDPFFTTKADGTGLGLPLSLGIVDAHGGSIQMDSRVGRGTQLVIYLPIDETVKGTGT